MPPADRVGEEAAEHGPDEPARARGCDQRAGSARAPSAGRRTSRRDRPENPEAETDEKASGEQSTEATDECLPDETDRHQGGGEQQGNTRPETVRRVSDRQRRNEHRQRRGRQDETDLHGGEAEIVPDGGKHRDERRLGDAVHEGEREEHAELEIESPHDNSIVTAD